MTSPVPLLWTPSDWARAIASLPAAGPLPLRVAVVPREAVAHTLRRELLRLDLGHALVGTRFLTPGALAAEVLRHAGVEFTPGEDGRRRARLAALFRAGLPLRYFALGLLRDKPGWDEAFARTLDDLEAAALAPEDLERDGAPRLADIATVWRAANESAGPSWTLSRVLVEAAQHLRRAPAIYPFAGPALAVATGRTTAAEALLLRAIPGLRVAILGARPLRDRYADRLGAILDVDVRASAEAAPAPRQGSTERDLLASYLFEPPAVLADARRPRSQGPDGTVDLEEHAGVEEEIEATADWVARQIADGTPLEDIAVLVPTLDPLAGLVAERLARLRWKDGALPVHVDGGLPLASWAAGARALAVVRGLRSHLTGEALAELVPSLRTVSGDRLSRGRATDLVWALGTAGGNPARPDGALDWARCAAAREMQLEELIARAGETEDDDPERPMLARRRREFERLLADLRAIRPALDALCGVAAHVVAGASLPVLWGALCEFLSSWLIQPGGGPRIVALMEDAVRPLADDSAFGGLTGETALQLIEETIADLRVRGGRFGEPAVHVGTVAGATGLSFRSVRVIGLAEGHLPPVPREDPVLPDDSRRQLAPAVPTAVDRSVADLHDLDVAVRAAAHRVALSASRLDLDRSMREPSSVLLEAAAALGRPHAATGERQPAVPDVPALRRDAFAPARASAMAARRRMPLSEAAWLDGVAAAALGRPPHWSGSAVLDLDRVAELTAAGASALDGVLGPTGLRVGVPGSQEWPLSPSVLEVLLGCPHRFLFEELLGFEEPATAPSLREIDQRSFGGLFHRAAETLYRKHGPQIAGKQGQLDAWLAEADRVAATVFADFLGEYPLIGAAVRRKEHERLRAALHDLVAFDWETGPRQFVAVERSFGPLSLSLGPHRVVVRGRIDRLDVEGRATLVRDLKTGRPHLRMGRQREPDHVRDVQIAVYGLVAGQLAREWNLPARIAVGYAYFGRAHGERAYRDDFHETLEPAARGWLELAGDLLAARAFPRTPRPDDCAWCAFRPVCGDGAYERAGRILSDAGGPLRRFAELKNLGGPEEAEE